MNITLENVKIEQAIQRRNNWFSLLVNTKNTTWPSCKETFYELAFKKVLSVEEAIRRAWLVKQYYRASDKKTTKHTHKLWLSRKQVTKEEWLEILIPKLVSYCPKYNTVLDYGLVQNKITDLHIFRPSLDRIDNSKDEHPENLEIRSYQYNTSRGALSEEVFDELAKRQLKII